MKRYIEGKSRGQMFPHSLGRLLSHGHTQASIKSAPARRQSDDWPPQFWRIIAPVQCSCRPADADFPDVRTP
jgi:hypothetical protein